VDKHSTGGVGDKVSLMLAPIVAACGGYVPMISGRGLGHTGGTLDKLESIPGYNAMPDYDLFRQTVKTVGCAIIGQTARLAPADQRFYSIRDITATIESVDMITASILSKKLASGLDALIMDVKTGNGAFCASYEMAQDVAKSIATVASNAGVPTRCLITDMNQVLGTTVGNSVEMHECIEFLTNPSKADKRLLKITLDLAAHMLEISGITSDLKSGFAKAEKALADGSAAEVFEMMVSTLGGPNDLITSPHKHLAATSISKPIVAEKSGVINAMDVREIGLSMVAIKAGRVKSTDLIDHSVGLTEFVQIGDHISEGESIAVAHVRSNSDYEMLQKRVSKSVVIGEKALESPLTYEILSV
jgi:thymidine phosphorylase